MSLQNKRARAGVYRFRLSIDKFKLSTMTLQIIAPHCTSGKRYYSMQSRVRLKSVVTQQAIEVSGGFPIMCLKIKYVPLRRFVYNGFNVHQCTLVHPTQ
jgi:hypothetical protein